VSPIVCVTAPIQSNAEPTHLACKPSALLMKSSNGFNVVCPKCLGVILKAHTERAAFWNSGNIAQHIAACLGEF